MTKSTFTMTTGAGQFLSATTETVRGRTAYVYRVIMPAREANAIRSTAVAVHANDHPTCSFAVETPMRTQKAGHVLVARSFDPPACLDAHGRPYSPVQGDDVILTGSLRPILRDGSATVVFVVSAICAAPTASIDAPPVKSRAARTKVKPPQIIDPRLFSIPTGATMH